MKKVFIIQGGGQTSDMFVKEGWEVVDKPEKADLIQLTGGPDVDPAYYNQPAHKKTFSSPTRDDEDYKVFKKFLGKKPFAGICRGAQFLNVISGGQMYQHVNGHAINGTHPVRDLWTQETYQATSTHHQMMMPDRENVVVIGVAEGVSTKREWYVGDKLVVNTEEDFLDYEVLYYPHTRSLCFQPHPELINAKECRKFYFEYLYSYLFNQ